MAVRSVDGSALRDDLTAQLAPHRQRPVVGVATSAIHFSPAGMISSSEDISDERVRAGQ